MASFPTSIKSFATIVDFVDSVLAAHQNDRAGEIAAVETYLLGDTNSTVTTSNVTAAENKVYNLTIAGLTANRNFTVPVASAAGQYLTMNIIDGDDTYYMILIGASTVTINGGSAATEYSRYRTKGDSVTLRSTSTTNWQVLSKPVTSTLVQRVEGTPNTTYSSITTALPVDDTIPQNTEGGEVCTVTITPTSTTNRLVIRASFFGASDTALATVLALFQDSTANALAARSHQAGDANALFALDIMHEMAAGTTSATTFKLRAGNNGGATTYVNGTSAGRRFGGATACRISVEEIKV